MAVNFQLTRKGETAPTPLVKIDEELCALLGEPVDPKNWVLNWYGTIGFMLACGETWEGVREETKECFEDSITLPSRLRILDYLEKNYTSDAWASR